MSKSAAIMLGLIAFAIFGGPAIFYGLLAMSRAGVFDNWLADFWLISGLGIGSIVLVWIAILYLGHRATSADSKREQADG